MSAVTERQVAVITQVIAFFVKCCVAFSQRAALKLSVLAPLNVLLPLCNSLADIISALTI